MKIFGKYKRKLQRWKKKDIPGGVWTKCTNCGEMVTKKDLEEALHVCPKCNHHYLLSAKRRLLIMIDKGTFRELDADIYPCDPLRFVDSKPYPERQAAAREKSKGLNDAVTTGTGELNGIGVAIAAMDFSFMGGSMGSVVGERITRLIEMAMGAKLPLIIVSVSGGARMQESVLSLMQLAKTSGALARFAQKGLPYISVMADPTTGGTTASFASLGDVILAEPRALIGFAGPRVIKQTIQQDLPEGFQRSEFLLEHGFVDMIVQRKDLKETVAKLLQYMGANTRQNKGWKAERSKQA